MGALPRVHQAPLARNRSMLSRTVAYNCERETSQTYVQCTVNCVSDTARIAAHDLFSVRAHIGLGDGVKQLLSELHDLHGYLFSFSGHAFFLRSEGPVTATVCAVGNCMFAA